MMKQKEMVARLEAIEARLSVLESRKPETPPQQPEEPQGTDWADPALANGFEMLASLIPRRRFGSLG
jgi:hypothetical protein